MPDPVFTLSETYRLLAGIASLRQFTSAELADATGVNPSTTKSWLQRNDGAGRFVFKAGNVKGKRGRGRPPVLWQVKEEVVAEIRGEINKLGQLTEVSRGITSTKEAEAAYLDANYREAVRYHLHEAERAESPEMRSHAIARAQKWFDFEVDRLIPWRDQGFAVPDQVREDIANLNYRLIGITRNVDALQEIAYKGLLHLADYLHNAIEAWCAALGQDQTAFAPLLFEQPINKDLRLGLGDILNIILQTAEQVTRVRQGQVLCALVVALARVKSPVAYGAICDVIEREGHAKLGRALVVETQELPLAMETTVLLHQCLTGLREYPQLLSNDRIGLWVESLCIRDNYDRRLIAALLYCLERRTHVAIANFVEDRRTQIETLFADITQDPCDWDEMNRQVKDDLRTVLLKTLSRNREMPSVAQADVTREKWSDWGVDGFINMMGLGQRPSTIDAVG